MIVNELVFHSIFSDVAYGGDNSSKYRLNPPHAGYQIKQKPTVKNCHFKYNIDRAFSEQISAEFRKIKIILSSTYLNISWLV